MPYPVSKVCPTCGSARARKLGGSDWQWLADRECASCGTRYTPPMPAWGPWLALLCGAAATAVGGSMLYDWATARSGYRFTLTPCVLLIGAGFACIGVGARGLVSRR